MSKSVKERQKLRHQQGSVRAPIHTVQSVGQDREYIEE